MKSTQKYFHLRDNLLSCIGGYVLVDTIQVSSNEYSTTVFRSNAKGKIEFKESIYRNSYKDQNSAERGHIEVVDKLKI